MANTLNTTHWTTGRLLSTAARLNERLYNQRLREVGLTHAAMITLRALSANGPISQTGLAELVHVQAQTMGKVLEKLEYKDLISRTRDSSDRRSMITRITNKGDELLQHVNQMSESGVEDLGLTDQKLRDALITFIATLGSSPA
ncbi:MarR family winged helix-turn-helix transcriptional regulator [Arthrobacter sp. TMN-50]